jgi:hypothetical protein
MYAKFAVHFAIFYIYFNRFYICFIILLYIYIRLFYIFQGFYMSYRKGEIKPLANIQKRDIYIQDVHIVQIGHTCPMFDYIIL